MSTGFVPCFRHYRFDRYPIDAALADRTCRRKLAALLTGMLEAQGVGDLCQRFGVGKSIVPIRPTDAESKRIIAQADYPGQIYRIDYGNTPLRILFGIQNEPRIIHLLMVDTQHETYSGKNRR